MKWLTRVKEWFSHRKKARLVCNDERLLIICSNGDSIEIKWCDVEEIIALKRDLGMYDLIVLGFKMRGVDGHYFIDEEMDSYSSAVKRIEERFSFDHSWWSTIAFPAFETNLSSLWKKDTSTTDEGGNGRGGQG